ncbi:hypothetical protein AVEN_142161-1 [Araneus ventricosus]|uniref:Uncharacterized protein n=1 Tax=Araneus ventricosus TaxID=182803 RepID=A0A4Y2IKN0_ARAVE|nr:hypothetical protein AVEN_142161-1 [Araneus ventricosus]
MIAELPVLDINPAATKVKIPGTVMNRFAPFVIVNGFSRPFPFSLYPLEMNVSLSSLISPLRVPAVKPLLNCLLPFRNSNQPEIHPTSIEKLHGQTGYLHTDFLQTGFENSLLLRCVLCTHTPIRVDQFENARFLADDAFLTPADSCRSVSYRMYQVILRLFLKLK